MTATRAYLRISTAKQADRASLDTQRAAIERFAAPAAPVTDWYTDIQSGRRDDRPEYVRLLRDLQPGDTLLVWRLDRIGRKKSELFRLFEECKRRHIRLISVTQPELSNELARDLMSVIAAYESQQLAERSLPGMMTRVEQGKWVSRIPKWYAMGSDGHLVPAADAGEAQAVWEMVLRTGSIEATAAAFGLNTISLRATLGRRVYLGETVWNGIVIPNTHPAIVRRETWEAVAAMRAERARTGRRERHGTAMLTGFIYVAESDRRMHHYQRTQRGMTRRYYVTVDGTHLPNHSVRAADVERAVVNALKTLTLTPETRRTVERNLRERAKRDPEKRERARLERRLVALADEAVNTARMEAQGRITPRIADDMRAQQQRDYAATRANLDALPQIVTAREAAPLLDLRIGLADRVEAAYAAGNWRALRILVEAFIARVEVRGGEATRQQWRQAAREIEVKWNPRSLN